MPSNDQLLDMLRNASRGTTVEEAFSVDGLTGDDLVVARQFAELAFLVCDRVGAGQGRVAALLQLKRARDAAIDARRPRLLRN